MLLSPTWKVSGAQPSYTTYRGSSLPEEAINVLKTIFHTPTKQYRVAMFLATSLDKGTATNFALNIATVGPIPGACGVLE